MFEFSTTSLYFSLKLPASYTGRACGEDILKWNEEWSGQSVFAYFNHNPAAGLIFDNLAFHAKLSTNISEITSKERYIVCNLSVKDIPGKVHRTNFDHISATKCPSDYSDTGNFRDKMVLF